MDPQIEELKELVRQNITLSQETNKMLRGMRSAGRLKSLLWFLIFAASLGISAYGYFYFVAPRIEQIKNLYEENMGQAQSFQGALDDFFKNFGGGTTTP